jgi:nickel/cobalt transporter (NicO) family protein
MSILGSLELALALGMRHALEIDHVAAVGTLIDQAPRPLAVTQVAARWALGHAVTLLGAGLILVLTGVRLPSRFEFGAELAVAGLLVALGLLRLLPRRAVQGGLARGAFAVGLLHGLAGSGPLVLLAVSTLGSGSHALLYLGLVSLGTLLGMLGVAGVFSLPLAHVTARARAQRAVEVVAGLASIVAGTRIAAELLL